MYREFELLKELSFFKHLPQERLESSSLLWTARTLRAGENLWWQGQPAEEFAFICSGKLTVHIADEDIAEITVGEMLGEAGVFTKEQRNASVSALEDSELLCLPMTHLETLRGSHSDIYDLILDQCLNRMALRVQEMGRKIARLARGDSPIPERKTETAFGKFWKRLTGSNNQIPASAMTALRKLPKLKEASKDSLIQIISAMTPHKVDKGTPIFLEADPGDSVFLLADGCVDVKRNVRGGKSERLASLYTGAIFGTGSLLLRERRNAACVASANTDCWVYEMDLSAHRSLTGEAGRLWRESLVAALAFQLRSADNRLIVLKRGKPSMSDYDKIRGGLEGYQGG
ncbi:MAG: cyclic nucleotide-binding domain-containing protein [Myxococcota bacterium]|nr:cyclic nucleotide-binding domain-containing protein [Myxococcota bacterium]